jgi:hypothetical protein
VQVAPLFEINLYNRLETRGGNMFNQPRLSDLPGTAQNQRLATLR